MGAHVGGGLPIKINHTPLVTGSPVTKQVIILAEAGTELSPTPPPYSSRLTSQTNDIPIQNRTIRMTVRYRFVTQDQIQSLQSSPPAETDLPSIDGPDPSAFAFEIPPNIFNVGILQYRIIAERLVFRNGALVVVGKNTFPAITSQNTEPWLTVNVTANATQVFSSSGGRFVLNDGNPVIGKTTLDVPAGILSGPTRITIDQVPADSPVVPPGLGQAFAVYHLDADQPIHGIMQLSVVYPDFQFPQGQDGTIDGTNVPVQNITVMWWDGFVWKRMGGTVNTKTNTIALKVASLGFFAILAAPPLSPEDRRPLEKILTPNGDGKNDFVNFSFGDLNDNIKVEIFDISGHLMRTIMSASTMQWDGRTDSGEIVESGVYIYQYTVDGKMISGLIAVAK